MKRQIRFGVFESNSSSSHSLTMCMKSDYDRWKKDGLYLFDGNPNSYIGITQPKPNHFYTREEALSFLQRHSRIDKNFDWKDKEEVDELLHEWEWYDYDYFWEVMAEESEDFEQEFTTASGEEVVAFGYYGW